MKNKKNILLLGPTATGKTAFAVRLADSLGAEIISVDSRQVYRGLNIGSGKDIREYTLPNGCIVPYHLIDVAEPSDIYSLADFISDSAKALEIIHGNGSIPLFAGGTALYIHALLNAYELRGGGPDRAERERLASVSAEELCEILAKLDPDSATIRHESSNRTRLIRKIELAGMRQLQENETGKPTPSEMDFLILGIYRNRSDIRARIEKRLDVRLRDENMLDEARNLHESGISWERLEYFGLEYRQMALHLQGKITYQEMRDTLLIKIRQFAKRQDTWFRKMERDGFDIHWQHPDDFEKALTLCRDYLSGKEISAPVFRLSEINYGS